MLERIPTMMFVAALLSAAAIQTAMAPSPEDLCQAIAYDSGTRGYATISQTCLLEDFGPDGVGWEVIELEDVETEDYPELPRPFYIQGDEQDCDCSEFVLTLPPVYIYSTASVKP